MADIKFSELQKATISKDSDEIAILQDGVNKMIASPILESKIINKTVTRVIEQGGASLNLINLKGIVPTYADLSTITPTPELNDAYQVEIDGLVYVYTDSGFQADGEGIVIQPAPIGVVEEDNPNAVSGGEVFLKYGDVDFFSKKGKYTSNTGLEVVNSALETTDFINISNVDSISGIGRGASTSPMITFFDSLNNVISSVVGSSSSTLFNINKVDFPANSVSVKINALLNEGKFYKKNIQELSDRIDSDRKIKINTKNGYYLNTSNVEVAESSYKISQLFPINKDSIVKVFNASTNGSGVKPVIFLNSDKQVVGFINATVFSEIFNTELNSSNIPIESKYFRCNSNVNNDFYIKTNTDIIIADFSTKEVDASNFVEKEDGKGLYPNSDANKVSRLITNGVGTKALFDDGKYKEINISGDVIVEEMFNMDKVISNSITSSKFQTKKPKVVLTFDDGRLTDYTHVKPLLDDYGVKGVFYVNNFDITDKMTTAMIQEMSNEGHEIGSHTLNHRILSAVAVLAPNVSTDTLLKVASSYGSSGFLELASGEIMRMYAMFGTERVEVNVINSYFSSGNWWLELESPIGRDITVNTEFFVTEENAVYQAGFIKDKLNSINVECNGFAYPYGSANNANKVAMQSLFTYSRNAYSDNNLFRIFGGIDSNNFNDFFDQYELPSIEIPNLTYTQIDAHITNVINNKGVLCLLGHSTDNISYDLYPKLRYIIEKCQELDIEITTMSEALKTHGNTYNSIYSNANSEGLEYNNGLTVLPPNLLSSLENTINYPTGMSLQRVYSGGASGYPEVGTMIRINSGHKNSGKINWHTDYFIGLESGYIYYRKRNGTFTATNWECLSVRKGTVFPTTILSVGCSFYRTDLNKIFYYDGTSWRDATGTAV